MSRWDLPGDDWVRRSRSACDTDLLKSIVADNRAPMTPRSAITPQPNKQQEEPRPYTHGWTDPAPLRQPEGINLIDGLVDAQDKRDLVARAKELAVTQHVLKSKK
jgi:hypothetical protein